MKDELLNNLFELMKWLVICPGLGLLFTIALLSSLRAMGIELKNLKAMKLWASLTLFVFGLCVLLQVYV
jgi:hypothetical protein